VIAAPPGVSVWEAMMMREEAVLRE